MNSNDLIEVLASRLKPVSILPPTTREARFLLSLVALGSIPISILIGFNAPVWRQIQETRWWWISISFSLASLLSIYLGLQFRYPEKVKLLPLFYLVMTLGFIATYWDAFAEVSPALSGTWGWRCTLAIVIQNLAIGLLIRSMKYKVTGFRPRMSRRFLSIGIALIPMSLAQLTCQCVLPGHHWLAHFLPAMLMIPVISWFFVNRKPTF